MLTQKSFDLTAGFMVVHANLPEQLRALCTAWMAAYPLDVFEAETILVQSNGIAQWLKLALAAEPAADGSGGLGIACGLRLAMHTALSGNYTAGCYLILRSRNTVLLTKTSCIGGC